MGDVTDHDFGKKQRDAARAYGRLVGIVEAQAEAFLKDPSAFFQSAGDEIGKLRLTLHKARDALRAHVRITTRAEPIGDVRMETINVVKVEYERLKACAQIVRDAVDNA